MKGQERGYGEKREKSMWDELKSLLQTLPAWQKWEILKLVIIICGRPNNDPPQDTQVLTPGPRHGKKRLCKYD